MTKKFSLGNLELNDIIFYAPLAGVSDYPFRKVSAHYSPSLMFCEMVKIEPVVRGIEETLSMLKYSEDMRPIGAQICGSDPKIAFEAAKIIEEMGFDLIDLNCGCPVDKITKKGCGSGMLKTPELIGEVISAMVSAVKIPVTVKIRAGWDEKTINAPLVTRIAEDAGAVAICVHGRTREQGYRGPAKWDYITESKKAAKNIKVIGNGDLFAPEDPKRMMEQTGCDAVLISRGTMGQPWIAEDIRAHFRGEALPERGEKDRMEALKRHFEYSSIYKEERAALIDMRRALCWYIKEVEKATHFRKRAVSCTNLQEVALLIEELNLSVSKIE